MTTLLIILIITFFSLYCIHGNTTISLLDGMYEKSENIELVYQFPPLIPLNEIKGMVFLAHGCSHRATDFWPKTSTCQQCIGLPIECMIVTDTLNENMIALAISSSNTQHKCWNDDSDIINIITIFKYFHTKYLQTIQPSLPLYLFGASSGGHMVGILGQIAKSMNVHIAGIIIQISSLSLIHHRHHNQLQFISSPIVFIHMTKDIRLSSHIDETVTILNQANLPAIQFPIAMKPIPLDYFTYANVLNGRDSKRFVKELMLAKYIRKTNNNNRNANNNRNINANSSGNNANSNNRNANSSGNNANNNNRNANSGGKNANNNNANANSSGKNANNNNGNANSSGNNANGNSHSNANNNGNNRNGNINANNSNNNANGNSHNNYNKHVLTNNNVMTAINANGNDYYLLSEDPRESNWREIARKALPHITPSIDSHLADQSAISELLNVAWAYHEITQESFLPGLRWIQKNAKAFSNHSQCLSSSLLSSSSSSSNDNDNKHKKNSATPVAVYHDISCD